MMTNIMAFTAKSATISIDGTIISFGYEKFNGRKEVKRKTIKLVKPDHLEHKLSI